MSSAEGSHSVIATRIRWCFCLLCLNLFCGCEKLRYHSGETRGRTCNKVLRLLFILAFSTNVYGQTNSRDQQKEPQLPSLPGQMPTTQKGRCWSHWAIGIPLLPKTVQLQLHVESVVHTLRTVIQGSLKSRASAANSSRSQPTLMLEIAISFTLADTFSLSEESIIWSKLRRDYLTIAIPFRTINRDGWSEQLELHLDRPAYN